MFGKFEEFICSKVIKCILSLEAVEYRENGVGCFYFNAVVFKNVKGKLTVDAHKSYFSDKQLVDWISENKISGVPIVLNYNSDKIVHHVVDSIDAETTASRMVPNFSHDIFYVQKYSISESKSVVSIVRKSGMEKLLDLLSPLNACIISGSIGPFFVLEVYRQIFDLGDRGICEAVFENYVININDDEIVGYKIGAYYMPISGENIYPKSGEFPLSCVLAYSYGAHFFLSGFAPVRLPVDRVNKVFDEFIFSRTSKVYTYAAGILLLVLLLVSSICFTIFTTKYENLESVVAQKHRKWNDYLAKEANIQSKREFFRANGLVENSSISYYANELTVNIPETVYLTKMIIHPAGHAGYDEDAVFAFDRIHIYGLCNSPTDLNTWVNELKGYSWIKSLLIKNYKEGEQIGNFNLEITKNL